MSYIKKLLEEVKNIDDNKFCADCKTEETLYASINNGVFLCFQCADFHSSMGKQTSYIRNLSDPFDEYLILYLIRGGNFRYKNFLFDSGIKNDDIDRYSQQNYFTKGMDYYRRNVKKKF